MRMRIETVGIGLAILGAYLYWVGSQQFAAWLLAFGLAPQTIPLDSRQIIATAFQALVGLLGGYAGLFLLRALEDESGESPLRHTEPPPRLVRYVAVIQAVYWLAPWVVILLLMSVARRGDFSSSTRALFVGISAFFALSYVVDAVLDAKKIESLVTVLRRPFWRGLGFVGCVLYLAMGIPAASTFLATERAAEQRDISGHSLQRVCVSGQSNDQPRWIIGGRDQLLFVWDGYETSTVILNEARVRPIRDGNAGCESP